MTSNQAENQLALLFPWMRDSWHEGWNQYLSFMDPEDDSRARSTIIQMRAVIAAKRSAHKIPELQYIRYNNSHHLFELKNTAIIQFKKLDTDLIAQNNHTDTSRLFYGQEILPGLSELPHFTCGYVPNLDHTQILSIHLTFPRTIAANSWALDITGKPARSDAEQYTFDEQPSPAKRIKARNGTDLNQDFGA